MKRIATLILALASYQVAFGNECALDWTLDHEAITNSQQGKIVYGYNNNNELISAKFYGENSAPLYKNYFCKYLSVTVFYYPNGKVSKRNVYFEGGKIQSVTEISESGEVHFKEFDQTGKQVAETRTSLKGYQ